MNSEKAGERVFGNVDEALAERIISRSVENGREPAGCAYGREPRAARPSPILKIALPAALLLIALCLLIRRRWH